MIMGSTDEHRIHSFLSSALLFASIPTFVVLLGVVSAPYGKHSPSGSTHMKNTWGPTLNARLAWFLFECPNLLWSMFCYYYKDDDVFRSSASSDSSFTLSANQVLLLLFVIHYIHRCLIYPLRMNPQSQPVNMTVILSAFFFCSLNGYLQARALCSFHIYPKGYHYTKSFRLGVAMWLIGLEHAYHIPHGGLFKHVSAANYLGEIVEWGGFAIASQTKSAFAFWLFVCANLIPRAYSHHKWYIQKFDDYPRNRKAIIPFTW